MQKITTILWFQESEYGATLSQGKSPLPKACSHFPSHATRWSFPVVKRVGKETGKGGGCPPPNSAVPFTPCYKRKSFSRKEHPCRYRQWAPCFRDVTSGGKLWSPKFHDLSDKARISVLQTLTWVWKMSLSTCRIGRWWTRFLQQRFSGPGKLCRQQQQFLGREKLQARACRSHVRVVVVVPSPCTQQGDCPKNIALDFHVSWIYTPRQLTGVGICLRSIHTTRQHWRSVAITQAQCTVANVIHG